MTSTFIEIPLQTSLIFENSFYQSFIKYSLAPIPRSDLASDSDDFETVWTEVENPKYKKILIYRHPNSDPESFNEYSKSPHIRTYQNKNLEAVSPKLCTLQSRICFSLMKFRFFLQGLQN